MPTSLFEIIELTNGDIVLQRADEESAEALVSIRFSDESLHFLKDAKFDIAKAMIEAGMDAAAAQAEQNTEINFDLDERPSQLH